MDLIEMYPAAVNSKVTVTLGVLNADSTIIEVLDGSVLPDAPNLLVLGSDQTAETVKLTAKEGNTLTVERGIQGNAIAWPAGTQVARNFTAKDWNDMIANIANIVAKVMGLSAADVHARPDTWMPTASDVGALKVYGSLSELGLSEETATAEQIVNKMDDESILLHQLTATATSAALEFPYNYSMFRVTKRNSSYVQFECIGTGGTGLIYYGYYNGGASVKWSGWSTKFVPLNGVVPMTNTIKVENKNGYSAIDKVRTVNGVDYMERLGVGSIDNIPAVSIELTAPSGNPSYARLDLFEDKVTFQSNNGTRKALFGEHNFPAPMPNAGFHNSVYRGKSLGSAVTAAQWTAIKDGTFDDMFIGDYWTIGGINYRIAAFDYYYKTGDTSCETHHVVLVPDTNMYTHVMNDTNITDGAYVGSKMYTAGLTQAKTTVNNAFGSAHILKHRQYLQNATSNGISTGGAWYDSTVELMTEQNVHGCKIFGDVVHGTTFPNNYTIDKSQYPLFAFRPDMISNRQWFWLRDVANASDFANVVSGGDASNRNASNAHGVRPAFSIC